jgi:hypothetical protein
MKMVKSKDNDIKDDVIYDQLQKKLGEKLVSNSRDGKSREVKDLLKGRFTINKIQRIVYGESHDSNSNDDIFGKAFDYSTTTVKNLIAQGYGDAHAKLG